MHLHANLWPMQWRNQGGAKGAMSPSPLLPTPKKKKSKMGPFEKIVDHIWGFFNFYKKVWWPLSKVHRPEICLEVTPLPGRIGCPYQIGGLSVQIYDRGDAPAWNRCQTQTDSTQHVRDDH